MGGLMMELMELMKDYLNTHKKRKKCLIKKGLEREIGKTHIITLYQYTSEKNICYKIKIATVDRKINKTRNCHITDKNDAFEIYAYFVKKYVEPRERISMMWQIHDSNNKTPTNHELMKLECIYQDEYDNYCAAQAYKGRKGMKDLLTATEFVSKYFM